MTRLYKISSYLAYPVIIKVDLPPVETIMIHPYAVLELEAKALIEPLPSGLQVYAYPTDLDQENNQTVQTELRLKKNQLRSSSEKVQDSDNNAS